MSRDLLYESNQLGQY